MRLVTPGAKVSVTVEKAKSDPEVAVPPTRLTTTVTVLVEAWDRVTVRVTLVVPLLPSATDALPIDTVGIAGGGGAVSSLRIVTVAAPRLTVAPVTVPRTSWKASSLSTTRSPSTLTRTTICVCPGANTRVPLAPEKSTPEVAVPATRDQGTLTVAVVACDRVTVTVAVVVPELPSWTLTSATLTEGTTGGGGGGGCGGDTPAMAPSSVRTRRLVKVASPPRLISPNRPSTTPALKPVLTMNIPLRVTLAEAPLRVTTKVYVVPATSACAYDASMVQPPRGSR